MSVKQEDIKPTLNEYDAFNIPVEEEEELEVGPSHGQTKIWAMKIPAFLFERWERVKASGVHLGTLVVDNSLAECYNPTDGSTAPPTITLKLPKEEEDKSDKKRKRDELDTRNIPDEYRVDMRQGGASDDRVKNKFIFSEHKRTWVGEPGGPESGSKKRKKEKAHPCLIGPVDHEASVQPIRTPAYLKLLAQRRLDSEQSKRPIIQLDDKNTSQAKLNQLASGFSNASSTLGKKMVAGSEKVSGDRNARLDKRELTDRLFALFSEKRYWSIAALKATLNQPDAWLREVLKDVAVLIREGKMANYWELRDDWKGDGEAKDEAKEEDEDDEDDSDLEEVQLIE